MSADLYQEVILEHNKHPRNFGTLEEPCIKTEGHNPLCGDRLELSLRINDAGLVEDVKFSGSGCAISKASASMMTQAIKGKSLDDAKMLFEEFRRLITGELKPESEPNHLGKLTVFSGIWQYPARVKCAILSWHTMKNAIDGQGTAVTEDKY